jgi:DNA-binding MarR family transcriptional regulator
MLDISVAIQQTSFKSVKEKALINFMYTGSWINMQQLRFFKAYGVSPQQYNVLRILRGQYPNAVTVSLIQERMLDRMSNASRLVDKLYSCKLADRYPCEEDRRQVRVKITEKGLGLLSEIDAHQHKINDMLGALNEQEAEQLNQLLNKIRNV